MCLMQSDPDDEVSICGTYHVHEFISRHLVLLASVTTDVRL